MQDIRARLLQFVSQPVSVQTEELGTIYIRRITLGELDKIQSESKATPKEGEVPVPPTVRMLARFFGDEKGQPLFDLAKAEDRDQLMAFPVSLVARVLNKGNEINNMNAEEKDKEKNA